MNLKKKEPGLAGITALDPKKNTKAEKAPEVMTIEQARKMEYQPVKLEGIWLILLGAFCLPTHFFVYGKGGSGKTSFVLLFSQYLASLRYKILYEPGEQFNTPTFTEILNRLNIQAGDNFQIVKNLNTLDPEDFDFIVLDSKDTVEVSLEAFLELSERYKKQSFIILSQSTKDGDFTGSERWRNTVDVMIEANNGLIKTGHDKNRWGGAGEMRVY